MKKLLCVLLGALLLTGCGKIQPDVTVATTPSVAPDPTPTGVYVLQEQVSYDAKDRKSVGMTVTFDEQMLPTSIFMDSGTDVTYTLNYDESSMITGFTMVRTLYGEETTGSALVNDHGDIIEKTTDGKTSTVNYGYDDRGNMIKKETFSGGNLTSVTTWAYDDRGNQTQQSYTSVNGGYTKIYENTYDGELLTAIHCKPEDGDTDYTESFTYDDRGLLTRWEQVSGAETIAAEYTYNEQGLLTVKTSLLNGQEQIRLEFAYDDLGRMIERKTYENGQYQGRTTYSWTNEPVLLTDAQQNILQQLGALL